MLQNLNAPCVGAGLLGAASAIFGLQIGMSAGQAVFVFCLVAFGSLMVASGRAREA